LKKLRTAVSGLGRIGWLYHIPGIMANEGFELTAVCDPLRERLNEAYEKYSVKGYTSFEEMIDAERPDLAVVASPTHLHAGQAVYALEHGVDVFLDKPMARDLAEADTIVKAKERTGKKLMMYQPSRFSATTQKLKKIIQSGVIGDVYMIKSSSCGFVFRNDWQSLKKYGGGMLNNYGAHSIDAALYLCGSTAKEVYGRMRRVAAAGDADDVVKILIETANGIAVDIDIILAAAASLPPTVVFGTHGAIEEIHGDDKIILRVRYFDPIEQKAAAANDSLAAEGRRYATAVPVNWKEAEYRIDYEKSLKYYEKCYEYFALDMPPFVDISESREVMRVMEECRRSAGWSQD